MTEDRLTDLLAEAADLPPSDALRDRVGRQISALPSGGERSGVRGRRIMPWFALSGATAALAVAAFVSIPRPASAAELVQRAGRAARANLTYRTTYEDRANGKLAGHIRTVQAPGWQLCTWPDGRFQLRTPSRHYSRLDLSGPIRMTRHLRVNPAERALDDDPSPENYVRLLRSINPGRDGEFGLVLGRSLDENGHRLREIVITEPQDDWMRTRYLIDESTDLTARVEQDVKVDGTWRLNSRTTFAFPGPEAGSETFTRPLRSAKIVDVEAEEARWTRRLARVQRLLRLSQGEPLALRDLRRLESGDVLLLYTGPQRVLATLSGPRGEPFALCQSVAWASIYPDRRHIVRLLRFVPLDGNSAKGGPLTLDLFWNGRTNGSFRIDPPLQRGDRPDWATAMNAPFGREGDLLRAHARIASLADRWLDVKGKALQGYLSRDPNAELRTAPISNLKAPPRAVRHDPKAAEEAARQMRDLIARLAARGAQEDPFWTGRLLARLDAWALGKR